MLICCTPARTQTEHLGKGASKEAADILKLLEDKCNECDDQVEHTGILDLGRQHKLQQARNAARDVFVLHCTITCPDPTHPRTWDATGFAALGQAWWNRDQRAQMHRAYSAIQQLFPVHRFPTSQELRIYPRKRHPRVGISSNELLREHGFGVREHSSGASTRPW